ncbi:MAG TPA: Na+/H+ antiporter NhaA [Myxococcaceae bacterium]|nr:Na+/H+ antiporter NhaA [Myxococcaceae bacterium]
MPDARPQPRLFRALVAPFQAFLRTEAKGGILLLLAALVALALANSPWHELWHDLWELPLRVGPSGLAVEGTLHFVINDVAMAIFFFVVGLEIKRELVRGELRTPSQALLPAIAAVGGTAVPALLYLAIQRGGDGARGWAIPMATDIAFSIGCLALLGPRVPHGLRVFLTALAIFDDIAGILVIALFYGSGIQPLGLVLVVLAAAFGLVLNRLRVQSAGPYLAAGAALWFAFHSAGLHATLAGVVLGLLVPAHSRRTPDEVFADLKTALDDAMARGVRPTADQIASVGRALADVSTPLDRFEYAVHPFVAYGVMPLFALANSGVHLGSLSLDVLLTPVFLGTAAGLFLGKTVGIFAFTRAAVASGLARVPSDAPWSQVLGVSAVAGIGFTVALFIANLAFAGAPLLLDEARLGILVGSAVSGTVGVTLLRLGSARAPAPEAAAA